MTPATRDVDRHNTDDFSTRSLKNVLQYFAVQPNEGLRVV